MNGAKSASSSTESALLDADLAMNKAKSVLNIVLNGNFIADLTFFIAAADNFIADLIFILAANGNFITINGMKKADNHIFYVVIGFFMG